MEVRRIFQTKIENIFSKLSAVNIVLLGASKHNGFRKPRTGMWNYYIESILNQKLSDIDMESSFYVGDAAGRTKGWKSGVSQDFASSDRKFAINAGLKFYTPEEFFLGHPEAPYDLGTLNPSKDFESLESSNFEFIPSSKQELVILVGSPASGKSSFYDNYLKPLEYKWINQDSVKTHSKCLRLCEKSLSEGYYCAIDNTNPSRNSRSDFINIAKNLNITIRCLLFETPDDIIEHLNSFRTLTGSRQYLPKVAFSTFKKFFEPPILEEGFDEIVRIPFVYRPSGKELDTIFKQYLN